MSRLLDRNTKQAAILGEPISFKGLNVFPIIVEQYKTFAMCESALMIRLSALPAVYACKQYAQALHSMAWDQKLGDYQRTLWMRFLTLLCLSLHIPIEDAEKSITLIRGKDDLRILKALLVTQNEKNTRLEIGDLTELRKIIAELNGRELPDEADNLELVEAEKDVLSASSLNLKVSHEALLASVARDQRIRMRDLMSWTIYEFELIRSAMERERRYTVYGIGEMGGNVKWPNGNPYPSLFFDREKGNAGVVDAADLQRRLGGAVQQATQLPNFPT